AGMRWTRAGGEEIPLAAGLKPREDEHGQGFSFGPASLAISRTEPAHLDEPSVVEIEQLYVDMIMSARKLIYAESQYFASRAIAQALAIRLAEPDGPEVILINPVASDNWLGAIAMDTARARLWESVRRHDPQGRFRIYHPVTARGQAIYVHSKLMIIDDEIVRVGSSNINNRSMRFDRECDVAFEARGDDALRRRIAGFRSDLLGEHLGVEAREVEHAMKIADSAVGGVEALMRRTGLKSLRSYETPEVSDIETWLADNEILDPEGPEELFEPIERRGLFRGRLRLPGRRGR
ncbi:MAG: phospholipase, partial [Zymomonas sp.]